MISSDWQFEQTGVDRDAGRLTILDGLDDFRVQIEWIEK